MSKIDYFEPHFQLNVEQKGWPLKLIYSNFLIKIFCLNIALKLNSSLKLIYFSFVSKLLCFVHSQAWSYKRQKGVMKVLQITWTLTLVALNGNMLYILVISWFRSKLWANLITLGLVFSLLMNERGMSQIFWKKMCFSRHLVIFSWKIIYFPICLWWKTFQNSEANLDLRVISFSLNLEFIVTPARL